MCVRAQYYRGAEAAIVVYDVTSFVRPPSSHRYSVAAPSPLAVRRSPRTHLWPQESFEGAKSWVRELKLNGQVDETATRTHGAL